MTISSSGEDWRSRFGRLGVRLQERLALGEGEIRAFFEDSPVRFVEAYAVAEPGEAVLAADSLGYPVVLKALIPGVIHKSDHNLVRVGLTDARAVTSAATELIAISAAHSQSGGAVALSVQRQESGVEIAVGLRRDPLGPMVMVAAGGTQIELVNDTAIRMAPIDRTIAAEMLRSLRLWPLLNSYRGSEPVDLSSILDLIVNLGQLALDVPEIAELDLNPIIVGHKGCVAVDGACVLGAPGVLEPAEPEPDSATLSKMMAARRIAVIGGTSNPLKSGALLLRYLKRHGFDGDLAVVNPGGTSVDGVPAYRSLSEIPHTIDLACILAPASVVPEIVEQCAQAGVSAGIIYSSGFAEAGPAGLALQQQVLHRAADRFRFIGPNSIGMASTRDHFFATFGMALEREVTPGSVGFVSQSGAIATSLLSRAPEFGISFSRWMTAGNEADLGVADCIANLAEDTETRAICMFLEVVRRPKAFRAACQVALASQKPILILKTGRSEAGRQAAASHTAALTGSDAAYDAFLADCGTLRVERLSELFVKAAALLWTGPISGRKVGLLTMSGGIASVVADECAKSGLDLPILSDEVQQQLRAILPAFAAVRNPIDVTAVGISKPKLVREALDILRNSKEVDMVLVQLTTNADPSAEIMAADLVAASQEDGPPVLVGRLGANDLAPRAMTVYRKAGMPIFAWPDQLVQAASAATDYGSLVTARRKREA